MKNGSLYFGMLLAAFLLPPPAMGQGITSEEVTQVMESAPVRDALLKCVAGKPHPATVDLDLIIDEKGACRLAYTNPVLDPELYACFSAAAAGIGFKATGQKFEITYPLELPAAVEPPPPLPPPDGTGAGQGTPGGQPPPPNVEETLRYKIALGMTVVGALFTAAGPAFVLTGVLIHAYWDNPLRTPLLYGFIAAGAVVLAGGIALLVIGVKRLKKIKQEQRSTGLVPAPGIAVLDQAQGMALTFRWAF
jgi:hypothetical protein